MVKRVKIAILYSYNENWIGGSYYILNIIKLLNELSFLKKPEIFIFYNDSSNIDSVKLLKYPYINYISIQEETYVKRSQLDFTLVQRILNFISKKIIKRNLYNVKYVIPEIDVVFPSDFNSIFSKSKNQLFWIPDFQDRYLKKFFSSEELSSRKEWQEKISNQKYILFSSIDALNDFKTFFPNSKSRCYVFSFVSLVDKTNFISLEELSNKYNLTNKKYFFVSNQFWIHKNHKVVFEAMRNLKEKNLLNFDVYFSGNQNDYRYQDYFNQLLNLIEKYKLTDNVKILGFIERSDQLSLMKHSLCVIQPSLFEGWSTVIEDAKSLDKVVICSNLKVHHEQLKSNGIYFTPDNYIELSDKMLHVYNNDLKVYYKYNKQILNAKKNIYNILKKIKN